jgi:hypothetical protein
MEDLPCRISIGSAGNTQIPALLALRTKGYRTWIQYIKFDDPNDSHYPYQSNYEAEKDGAFFSATSALELLGLVAMWETRGDDWKYKEGDPAIFEEMQNAARTFDINGNELLDDDDE